MPETRAGRLLRRLAISLKIHQSGSANGVFLAHVLQLQAVLFLGFLEGASGYDGLASALSTSAVFTGAEQEGVLVFLRHMVKEAAKAFVALVPVATKSGGGLEAVLGVVCAELLTVLMHVAGLRSVQAVVHTGWWLNLGPF